MVSLLNWQRQNSLFMTSNMDNLSILPEFKFFFMINSNTYLLILFDWTVSSKALQFNYFSCLIQEGHTNHLPSYTGIRYFVSDNPNISVYAPLHVVRTSTVYTKINSTLTNYAETQICWCYFPCDRDSIEN